MVSSKKEPRSLRSEKVRKTFLIWLFALMIIAFIGVLVVSFSILTKQASQNADKLIQLKLSDVEKQINLNQKNIIRIRQEADENALAKVHALAKMLTLKPQIIDDEQEIEKIRQLLSVDEIHISDEKGILIAGTVPSFIGYDYASAEQSAQFLPAITDPQFELAQDPMPRGINNEIFQYVGVARMDQPGIIQIGYTPQKLINAMEVADIQNLAAGFRVGNSGSVMIADFQGYILSTNDEINSGTRLSDIGLKMNQFEDEQGSFLGEISDNQYLISYLKTSDYLILGKLPTEEMYFSRDTGTNMLILFNILLFCAIFFLIAWLVQVVVINGIYKVNTTLSKITEGYLDEKVFVNNNKEFQMLSRGINTTVDALKDAIHVAESRIDSELAFAKNIQLSALPGPFERRDDFEIYGHMHTAKEVGGDFYDYFMIDDHHLGFLIADVSGKGIPAALFMMISKSIIKTYAISNTDLGNILFKSNNTLCENNESNMFVTVFMGILNVQTGDFSYASAGHNPPLIQCESQKFKWLDAKSDCPLAAIENYEFSIHKTRINPGESLFLYTDGVTEATNRTDELFSPQRLIDYLNSLPEQTKPESIMSLVRHEVERFSKGAEQADDITMLLFHMKGKTEK